MARLRQFIVSASAGRGGIRCGTYTAENPEEAIAMAQGAKARWAAVELDVEEDDLMWEVEEDVL